MASSKTQAVEVEPQTVEPQSVEDLADMSDARKAFMRGEIRWREYCEQEAPSPEPVE